jgi:hypothetical protein
MIKPITITEGAQIQAALDAAEGRATARCVSATEVLDVAERAERRLAAFPKAAWTGVRVTYLAEGPWANSYNNGRGGAAATQVTLLRRARDWVLIDARRVSRGRGDAELTVELPRALSRADAAAWLLKAAGLTAAVPAATLEGRIRFLMADVFATSAKPDRDLVADVSPEILIKALSRADARSLALDWARHELHALTRPDTAFVLTALDRVDRGIRTPLSGPVAVEVATTALELWRDGQDHPEEWREAALDGLVAAFTEQAVSA